jgi:hypothetical protein
VSLRLVSLLLLLLPLLPPAAAATAATWDFGGLGHSKLGTAGGCGSWQVLLLQVWPHARAVPQGVLQKTVFQTVVQYNDKGQAQAK